ncbi:MAG: iron-sulfur cluster assembly scaffold protein [Alphaproteobacteria bacterium]|nr:iron-sulfur cluster assembly scaffold protein [Alphaproteobacteria bacterium]
MSEVGDPLYSKALLRLAADATGAGRLPAPQASATAANPACGDRVTVDIALADGRVTSLAHDTHACILTQASAAILAGAAPGMNRAELAVLESNIAAMLKAGAAPPLPAYTAFAAAAALPARHVCVLLPFQALRQALENTEPG